MVISVLSLLFAFLMLTNPVFGGMSIVFWTGITLISVGLFNIFLSFKLKKLNSMPDKIPNELKTKLNQIQNEINDALKRN